MWFLEIRVTTLICFTSTPWMTPEGRCQRHIEESALQEDPKIVNLEIYRDHVFSSGYSLLRGGKPCFANINKSFEM